MKKRVLITGLFVLFILTASLVQAQTNNTEENQKVNAAYSCLQKEVQGNCESLSTEEKIFSLLSIGQCQSELISSSKNGECWPSGACNVKTTAQAILALDNFNVNTASAKSWLLEQKETSTDLSWYLQIESSEPTSCTIKYSDTSYNLNIGEDKKISNNAGSCLVLSQDDYWLRVSPSCFERVFEISCDKDFITSLIFRKTGSSTIHVFPDSSSASSGGTTREEVKSSCFSEGGICVYEGSLWASLVLDSLKEDISEYMPYLITGVEDNQRFLPESFLYSITGDAQYKNSLLLKQKSNQWWAESGDRYYDTALALYPFYGEDLEEKTNSKNWLLNSQETSGCWDSNNIRNTGFVLTSIWPRTLSGSGGSDLPDCEEAEYFCVSSSSCGGKVLSEYNCPGTLSVCCTVGVQQQTCGEMDGIICNQDEICRQGTQMSAGDISGNQVCCVGSNARCESVQKNECELEGGNCSTSCGDNEEISYYSCSFLGDVCCIEKTDRGGSLLWVWILVILIVLVVMGIIFKDKLRHFWFKIKSKFGRGGSRKGPGHRPDHGPPPEYSRPRHPPRHFPTERRILLPSQPSPSPKRKAPSGAEKELDEVLKKLKDMGK